MNKKTSKVFFVLVLISIFAFSSCKEEKAKTCILKEIRTLFTTIGIHDRDTSYGHYILVKDFSKKCMDSVTMVNLALRYIDTVKIGKPVGVVMFFNSDKDFIQNETSQIMEEINKSCLVVIGLDEKSNKPDDFIFYNDKGERIYWGGRWLPNGR
jgi:hypothetical protein